MNWRVLQEGVLQVFLEVAQAGSVTAAAARLDVAPSAVSRRITHLERELGMRLFERGARGMTLNPAGELLAGHARRAWLDLERLGEDLLALRDMRRGEVRLAATEGFGFDFLPAMAAQYRERCPAISFSVEICDQSEVVRRVRNGDVDIGVKVSLASEREMTVELRHPAPVYAVVAPGHPLASRLSLTLAQVLRHPLALPDSGSTLRQLLEISCSRQRLPLAGVFTSDHLFALINYVTATDAVTFSGALALRQHLQLGAVRAIALRDREMSERYFDVLTLAGRRLPEPVRGFLDHIRESLA